MNASPVQLTREEIKSLIGKHLGGLFDDYASQCGLDEEFNAFADALLARLLVAEAPLEQDTPDILVLPGLRRHRGRHICAPSSATGTALWADLRAVAKALDATIAWVRRGEGTESDAAEAADAALARPGVTALL